MLPTTPKTSQTLPRNFIFHPAGIRPPRTPEPGSRRGHDGQPCPPPTPIRGVEPYRLRRRRATHRSLKSAGLSSTSLREPRKDVHASKPQPSNGDGRYQRSLLGVEISHLSPPRTPIRQIYRANESGSSEQTDWDTEESASQGGSITRPSTACSMFSNSSDDSSVESFPSLGECSSTRGFDAFDDCVYPIPTGNSKMLSPLQAYAPKTRFQSRLSQKRTWSEDMDNHLWMTYMRYLQDPRHTPFKMLPGTAPPLGVCSRVVREAKKTWKGHGAAAASRTQRPTRRTSHRLESLASPMASSAMPVIVEPRKSHVPWPRSDAATRRRLRDLCKRKPSLSAYYTRILRSPSPAPQCAPPVYASLNAEVQPAAPVDVKSSFSTRDMNISLATSTSSTMRLDGILAQLASENEARPIPEQRPIRSFAHQKSQSLHIGLGNGAYPSRALASPFRPLVESRQGGASRFTGHESAQRLEGTPALELFAPAPLRTFKRSAQHDLHDMMSSNEPSGRPGHLVQGIFRSLESGHRRVRSRGFSLGDMSASPRPPAIFNSISSLEQRVEPAPQPAPARLFVLQDDSEAMNRLGSPFSESSMKPRFNTFPRAFSPIAVETTETDQPTAEASVSNQSAAYPFSFI